jgi:hypothetical protein
MTKISRSETACPRCGRKLVPIVYGYPPPVEAARRHEVVVGGCLLTENSPRSACPRWTFHVVEALLSDST